MDFQDVENYFEEFCKSKKLQLSIVNLEPHNSPILIQTIRELHSFFQIKQYYQIVCIYQAQFKQWGDLVYNLWKTCALKIWLTVYRSMKMSIKFLGNTTTELFIVHTSAPVPWKLQRSSSPPLLDMVATSTSGNLNVNELTLNTMQNSISQLHSHISQTHLPKQLVVIL